MGEDTWWMLAGYVWRVKVERTDLLVGVLAGETLLDAGHDDVLTGEILG